MKAPRFTDARKAFVLKQRDGGVPGPLPVFGGQCDG